LKDKPNIYFLAIEGYKIEPLQVRKKAADFLKDYEPNWKPLMKSLNT